MSPNGPAGGVCTSETNLLYTGIYGGFVNRCSPGSTDYDRSQSESEQWSIEAHLDSGNARYALILPESYPSGLAGYANRFPIGIARTVNNTFNLMALPVQETKAGELPLYAGTAAYPGPSPSRGNIGSPLLKDMIVKVDPANGIVSLERAKPGLESGCPTT